MMTKIYVAATINLDHEADKSYMSDIFDTVRNMMIANIPVEMAITPPDADEENDHKKNRTSYKSYYDKN